MVLRIIELGVIKGLNCSKRFNALYKACLVLGCISLNTALLNFPVQIGSSRFSFVLRSDMEFNAL